MEYVIVIEPTPTGFSAYVPDVQGCVAVGETEAEVTASIREALQFHLEELRLDGDPIPQPASRIGHVQVAGSPEVSADGEYAVIVEKGPTSYSSWVPNLPICVAVAKKKSQVMRLIREAIQLHLERSHRDGEPIPQPASRVAYVDVAEPAPVA